MNSNTLIPRSQLGLSRNKLIQEQKLSNRKKRILELKKQQYRYLHPEPPRIRDFLGNNFPSGPWTFLLRQDNKTGLAEVTFWPGEEDRLYKFLAEHNKSEDSSIFMAIKQRSRSRSIALFEDCVNDPWFDILSRHFKNISGQILNADVHRIVYSKPDYNYRKGAHHRIKRIMNYLGWTRGQNNRGQLRDRKATYTRGASRPLYLHYNPLNDEFVVNQESEAPWTKAA